MKQILAIQGLIVLLIIVMVPFAFADSFVYSGGVFTIIQIPGAQNVTVGGINNSGISAGTYFDSKGPHGFVDNGGFITTIDAPCLGHDLCQTMIKNINNSGDLVGNYSYSDIGKGSKGSGLLYSGGVYTFIDHPGIHVFNTEFWAINNSQQILGAYYGLSGEYGQFLYEDGVFYPAVDYPNAMITIHRDINDAGEIVGYFTDGSGDHGFTYIGGVFTVINYPGEFPWSKVHDTEVLGVSNTGDLVGTYIDNRGKHAFTYIAGVYSTFEYPDSEMFIIPTGINDSGEIVGTIGRVPEPSTLFLLGCSIIGLGATRGTRNLLRRSVPKNPPPVHP